MLKTLQNIKNIAFFLALMPTPVFSMDAELPEEVMHSVAALNAIKIPSYQELQEDKALFLFLKTESLLAKASVLGTKKRIVDALIKEESKLEHFSPKAKIKIKISILLKIQRIASSAAFSAARDAAFSAARDAASYAASAVASYVASAAASDAASAVASYAAYESASYAVYSAASYAASDAAKEIKWNTLTLEERKAAAEYMVLVTFKAVQTFIISNNSWFKDIITKTVDAHLENPPTEGWDEFKLNKKTIYTLFSKIEKGVDGKDISPYFTPYRTTWDQLFRNNKKAATILLGIQKYKKKDIHKDITPIIARMLKDSDEENI